MTNGLVDLIIDMPPLVQSGVVGVCVTGAVAAGYGIYRWARSIWDTMPKSDNPRGEDNEYDWSEKR